MTKGIKGRVKRVLPDRKTLLSGDFRKSKKKTTDRELRMRNKQVADRFLEDASIRFKGREVTADTFVRYAKHEKVAITEKQIVASLKKSQAFTRRRLSAKETAKIRAKTGKRPKFAYRSSGAIDGPQKQVSGRAPANNRGGSGFSRKASSAELYGDGRIRSKLPKPMNIKAEKASYGKKRSKHRSQAEAKGILSKTGNIVPNWLGEPDELPQSKGKFKAPSEMREQLGSAPPKNFKPKKPKGVSKRTKFSREALIAMSEKKADYAKTLRASGQDARAKKAEKASEDFLRRSKDPDLKRGHTPSWVGKPKYSPKVEHQHQMQQDRESKFAEDKAQRKKDREVLERKSKRNRPADFWDVTGKRKSSKDAESKKQKKQADREAEEMND